MNLTSAMISLLSLTFLHWAAQGQQSRTEARITAQEIVQRYIVARGA